MSCISYFQIHASRPERLIDFYSRLFGWTFEKAEGPVEYWTIGAVDRQGIQGGLMHRSGDSPVRMQAFNSFVSIVKVEALEATLASLAELGGGVVEAQMPIPGAGRLVYARDPDGNVFGMISAHEIPA